MIPTIIRTQFATDVKICQYAPSYNDDMNDFDKEWTIVSREVHCLQGSIYEVSHFMKLLDTDLVCAAIA